MLHWISIYLKKIYENVTQVIYEILQFIHKRNTNTTQILKSQYKRITNNNKTIQIYHIY